MLSSNKSSFIFNIHLLVLADLGTQYIVHLYIGLKHDMVTTHAIGLKGSCIMPLWVHIAMHYS